MTMAMAVLLKNPLRIVCIYAIRFILDVDEYRSGLTPPYGIEGKIRSLIILFYFTLFSLFVRIFTDHHWKDINNNWHYTST